MDLEYVLYDVEDAVGVITLNRPEAANAQNIDVLKELDWAWQQADLDPDVKVIVLRSNGKHFSAGHDMRYIDTLDPVEVARRSDVESHYDWETRGYFHFAKAWRDVPKPSIAAVQGKCIAAGLMLCWPCDLIMAADNAEFSDPVAYMGICGVEMHAHTWELGARKAKEILFTGDSVTAEEAHQLGMVNHVVPLDELLPATMALAGRIAAEDGQAGGEPDPRHPGLQRGPRARLRHPPLRPRPGPHGHRGQAFARRPQDHEGEEQGRLSSIANPTPPDLI
jgi:enoyl-CoA hydratase